MPIQPGPWSVRGQLSSPQGVSGEPLLGRRAGLGHRRGCDSGTSEAPSRVKSGSAGLALMGKRWPTKWPSRDGSVKAVWAHGASPADAEARSRDGEAD